MIAIKILRTENSLEELALLTNLFNNNFFEAMLWLIQRFSHYWNRAIINRDVTIVVIYSIVVFWGFRKRAVSGRTKHVVFCLFIVWFKQFNYFFGLVVKLNSHKKSFVIIQHIWIYGST